MTALRLPDPPYTRMSLAEYWAFLETCPPDEKWELLGGSLVAMAGGTMRHAQIIGNVFAGIRARLRGGPCITYASDANVSDAARDVSAYPDVVVRCGTPLTTERTMTDPHLIVEVTSPSSDLFDLGVKAALYQDFESLQVYVVVHQDEWRVEVRRRGPDGWAKTVLKRAEDALDLPSLGIALPLAEIYEGVELSP